jgi:very-short-patch-repair endonuclease
VRTEDRNLLILAADRDHLVGRREVRRSGLSARQWAYRVAAGEWIAVMPTVWRHAATPETWELRVRAGSRWLGNAAALAGRAAAVWWGLEGFERGEVEFVVPYRRRTVGGVAVRLTREWTARDLLRRDGIRLTSATRTIIDLAGQGASARELECAIDSAVRLRLTSVPTLTRRMQELSSPGRAGIPLLRELLLDSGGESALERRFLRVVREAGLPRPQTQVTFKQRSVRVIRVDFLYPERQIVVEVSGRVGHASDADRRKDARRRNVLQHDGFKVIEFTTADVMSDPEYVVSTIKRELDGRPVARTPR